MKLTRRDLLILLPTSMAAMALPALLVPSRNKPDCVVEVELQFPHALTRKELEDHLSKIQKADVDLMFADFIESKRMTLIDAHIGETSARWSYGFASVDDVHQWVKTVREQNLVDKDYMDGAFTWTSRLNGQIVA